MLHADWLRPVRKLDKPEEAKNFGPPSRRICALSINVKTDRSRTVFNPVLSSLPRNTPFEKVFAFCFVRLDMFFL